ncbi:hypothetical protein Tco_1565397, partial [Tanacetum coccineum]
MLPTRRTTRTTPATTTNPTTTVTEAQLQALIDQGVAAALAERDASRSRDGDNSHGSGTGGRRQMPTQRECTYTDFLKCQAENKRKFKDTSRNTQNQQQPFKRNNVARAYTAGPGDKKPYGGTKPLCAKRNYHHDGPCIQKCTNYKKLSHSARDCK